MADAIIAGCYLAADPIAARLGGDGAREGGGGAVCTYRQESLPSATVLKTQRWFVIWSVAIGVAIAGLLTGWTRLHTESVDARVAKRMADCKASSSTGSVIPITPEEFKQAWEAKHSATTGSVAISPDEAKALWAKRRAASTSGRWVPILPECNPDKVRALFTNEAQQSKATADNWGLAIIAVFCVPLLWYFLLDRLREISDAISRRE